MKKYIVDLVIITMTIVMIAMLLCINLFTVSAAVMNAFRVFSILWFIPMIYSVAHSWKVHKSA